MTFTASDVLLKAASRIEEEGMWCQGVLFRGVNLFHLGVDLHQASEPIDFARAVAAQNQRVPECAAGALSSAAVELNVGQQEVDAAMLLLRQTVKDSVTDFNDAPGRTAHEVAEAMRQAALQ